MEIQFNQLVLFQHIIEDDLIKAYVVLHTTPDEEVIIDQYYYIVRTLMEKEASFEDYLIASMFASEHPVLLKLCQPDYLARERDLACLKNDLNIIRKMLHHDLSDFVLRVGDEHGLLEHSVLSANKSSLAKDVLAYFRELADTPITLDICLSFIELLQKHGCGRFAVDTAFYVNERKEIVPSKGFAPLPWEDIYFYEMQKSQLFANTRSLVSGQPFHHVLLAGASGTGKSSSVKALVPLFEDRQCRLVQMHKQQLHMLPDVAQVLVKSPFYFILFIDDLSFEVNEDDYKFLKSFIEGGIMNDATNVAFYVTTNRRHLIKEMRQEREQEVHLQDSIQEMTSLSDRFGLTLTYEPLVQKDYFNMVRKMCEREDVAVIEEELEVSARRWSLRHGGMSGRVANQLVKHMIMEKNQEEDHV